MGIKVMTVKISRQQKSDLVVDGVIGYIYKGAPRNTDITLIKWASASETTISV
jgi:NAD(P)H-hydrate repair Nnr-like enzyme with NAD(P)H-hydrate epimerase domain